MTNSIEKLNNLTDNIIELDKDIEILTNWLRLKKLRRDIMQGKADSLTKKINSDVDNVMTKK